MNDKVEKLDGDGVAVDYSKGCTNCGDMGQTESGLCKNCVTMDVLGNPEGFGIIKVARFKNVGVDMSFKKVGADKFLGISGYKSECPPGDSLVNAMVRVAQIVGDALNLDSGVASGMVFESISIKKQSVTIKVYFESVGLGSIRMTAKDIHLGIINDLGRAAIKDLITGIVAYYIERNRQMDIFEKPAA